MNSFDHYREIIRQLIPIDGKVSLLLRLPGAPRQLSVSLLPGLTSDEILLYSAEKKDHVSLLHIPRHHPILIKAFIEGRLPKDQFEIQEIRFEYLRKYQVKIRQDDSETYIYCAYPDPGSDWCNMNGRVVSHSI